MPFYPIPARIDTVSFEGIDTFGQQLVSDGHISVANIGTAGTDIEGATGRIQGKDLSDGFHLRNGDTLKLSIRLIIPQETGYMNRSGTLKGKFSVSQYNEVS